MSSINPARLRKLTTWSHAAASNELQQCIFNEKSIGLIDLCSNDYLNLSTHPEVIQAANRIMEEEGVGAGASRLITGNRPIHNELETDLAKWLGQESVLVFPSGFQANLAAVIAIANRHTLVIADSLVHHSLLLGIQSVRAKLKRYKHNDLNELETILKQYDRKNDSGQQPIVITESLFSMEGSSPDIKQIGLLCEQFGAKLFVDEAHAIGIMGEEGRGLCYKHSLPLEIISGTFGKAFGSGGAFLASNAKMREHLIQTSGAFRYTTALAPPLAAASLAALKLIQTNPEWGQNIQKRSQKWRKNLEQDGWPRPPGHGQILSVVIGEDSKTLDFQNHLQANGILTMAIRPPTVPEGTSRLRLVLKKDLPHGTFKKLSNSLKTI